MTRICYLIPSLELGGTERQLCYLVKGLAEDHQIDVVCTRRQGPLVDDMAALGAEIHTLDGWGGWDPRARFRLRALFKRLQPDIVHTFLFGFDLPANQAARSAGVPVVISSRRQLATWKKARHLHIQRRANTMVNCIVANSRAVAEFACRQEGANSVLFRVIYNGIEADDFVAVNSPAAARTAMGLPDDKRVVGMVANFSPVKDHALFLAMARCVASRRDDVHFLLCGQGPLRDEIAAAIDAEGLTERFTVTNAKSNIADVYAALDVAVLCSKVEGFPNSLMEAMAAGKPVIGAAVGGIRELIHNKFTGLMVADRNPETFTKAIEELLSNPDEAAAMGQRAAAYVRAEFSVEKMVSAYRSLYQHMTSRPADEVF